MGSTSVNTKTRFLYQILYTKTRFSIPYIIHEYKNFCTLNLHENKNFLELNLHKNKILDQPCGGVFMEPLKNYTVHFDSKKRVRKIESEKECE